MADQVPFLHAELHRVQLMLNDVTAQRNRLQYEMDTIHSKHGTYRIICHLRNEIQRLTISKLLLIQSTAVEMDRLRQIIRSLSGGKTVNDFSIDQHTEYSHSKMLHDLLPPPTPTSPPSNFSWKETFNIDLREEDLDGLGNGSRLDHEDDIKIPEMNLDLEDGAMKPISSFNRDDHESAESENENDEDDDDQYVKERVASPEALSGSDNDADGDHEDAHNEHIAVAETATLFADSDDTDSNHQNESGGHHIPRDHRHHHDPSGLHPQHDASPQLQFAGDGDDLNQIHGVATDAPILPRTDFDIYGEEDHKVVINIENADGMEHDLRFNEHSEYTLNTLIQ